MTTSLIVGGTGTLAGALIPLLLSDPRITRIRCLSRGEHKQEEFRERFKGERIDWFLGDVRDKERVLLASEGCEQVYHLAAHKGVDSAEYQPTECIATNVLGTHNVIYAARKNLVGRVIFTSTDKSVEPINIYGATKLVAEKMMVEANVGRHSTRYSVCRYGNVLGSNGSVVQKWRQGWNSVTDPNMTRFFIRPKEAANFVYSGMTYMEGGEVFIPKMKSTTIGELYSCVRKDKTFNIVGVRPGEKFHECLCSKHEADLVTDFGWCFVRWPEFGLFPSRKRGSEVEADLLNQIRNDGYTSFVAPRFSPEELESICQ